MADPIDGEFWLIHGLKKFMPNQSTEIVFRVQFSGQSN